LVVVTDVAAGMDALDDAHASATTKAKNSLRARTRPIL
jgi:hypothetical protein